MFQTHFKFGNEHLRIYLNRIASVRNTVYHSNPISVRDAERTICYANDIIQAIKEFYIETNKEMEYNVPTIVKYSDTMGSLDYLEDARLAQGIVLDKRNLKIRPGDKISLEIEVDASYDPSDYQIEWKTTDFDCTPFQNTRRLTIIFNENHIGDFFHIQVLLTGKKEKWHRFKDFDDRLAIMFRVLPPI